MKSVKLFTLVAAISTCSAKSCSGRKYNDASGFPASRKACYPTNYYRTSDLGQTTPDDAKHSCRQQCTDDGSCGTVVAQVNKAADSNLYSGTCFFFATGQTVTPRRCADTAYLLEGWAKDNTLDCFSSSTSVASAFCSSFLGGQVVTSTTTTTPAPSTITVTIGSTTVITTVISAESTRTVTTVPVITDAAATATVTVTSTSTVVSSTGLSISISNAGTATKRDVDLVVAAKFDIVPIPPFPTGLIPKLRRDAGIAPAPACITSKLPDSRMSAACSCLGVSPSATFITSTLASATVTSTITANMVTQVSTRTASGAVTTVTVTLFSTVSATTTTTVTTVITTTISPASGTSTATSSVPPACVPNSMICVRGLNFRNLCLQDADATSYQGSPVVSAAADGQACVQLCAGDSLCNIFGYNYGTGLCTIYNQALGYGAPSDPEAYGAVYVGGTC